MARSTARKVAVSRLPCRLMEVPTAMDNVVTRADIEDSLNRLAKLVAYRPGEAPGKASVNGSRASHT
jgi:hypothetical protein